MLGVEMADHHCVVTAIVLLIGMFGPADAEVTIVLPTGCVPGNDAYFTGINIARVVINRDTTQAYRSGIDCTFHIVETGVNAGVELYWTMFNMAPAVNGACADYVEVSKKDVYNKLVSLTGRVCGATVPTNTTERVNEVIVQVRTSLPQGAYTGFTLIYKKTIAATNPDAGVTTPATDQGLIAAASVGAVLALILVALLVACIVCTVRHRRDVFGRSRPKEKKLIHHKDPKPVSPYAYLAALNPSPQQSVPPKSLHLNSPVRQPVSSVGPMPPPPAWGVQRPQPMLYV